MKPITSAIAVFESKIIEIRLAYRTKGGGTLAEMVEIIAERDEQVAQCIWAIELLHDAFMIQKEAETTAAKVNDKHFTNIL